MGKEVEYHYGMSSDFNGHGHGHGHGNGNGNGNGHGNGNGNDTQCSSLPPLHKFACRLGYLGGFAVHLHSLLNCPINPCRYKADIQVLKTETVLDSESDSSEHFEINPNIGCDLKLRDQESQGKHMPNRGILFIDSEFFVADNILNATSLTHQPPVVEIQFSVFCRNALYGYRMSSNKMSALLLQLGLSIEGCPAPSFANYTAKALCDEDSVFRFVEDGVEMTLFYKDLEEEVKFKLQEQPMMDSSTGRLNSRTTELFLNHMEAKADGVHSGLVENQIVSRIRLNQLIDFCEGLLERPAERSFPSKAAAAESPNQLIISRSTKPNSISPRSTNMTGFHGSGEGKSRVFSPSQNSETSQTLQPKNLQMQQSPSKVTTTNKFVPRSISETKKLSRKRGKLTIGGRKR